MPDATHQALSPAAQKAFVEQFRTLLLPHVRHIQARETLLNRAFLYADSWILDYITYDGTSRDFVDNLLPTLLARDHTPGCGLMHRLLTTLYPDCGVADRKRVDGLVETLPAFCAARRATVAAPRLGTAPSTPANQPTVFISFAEDDEDDARWMAGSLQNYGHVCSLTRHPDTGSDDWLAATGRGLSSSYAVILLLSKQTLQSRWVTVELLAALDKRKQIYPVLLPDGRMPGVLSGSLTPVVLDEPRDAALRELLERLPPPPPAAPDDVSASVHPDLIAQADEVIYMENVKLQELRHVAQYTRLGGRTQIGHARGGDGDVPTIAPRQELVHSRWRRDMALPVEERRFNDAVPVLKEIRRAVLLGEPGAGKTTTLYKVAADLIDAALVDRAAPVPLMVRLGLWTDPDEAFPDFLRRGVGRLGEGLAARLEAGRAVLLLDGLNEIPAGQQQKKYRQVDRFLSEGKHKALMAFVSCREQDYPAERALALDRVVVSPLDPVRVHEFVHNYLDPEEGVQAGEDLFWRLAGEDAEKTYGRFMDEVGGKLKEPFKVFWLKQELPDKQRWGYENRFWDRWRRDRSHPARLLRLAENPYMLFMLIDVYRTSGLRLPSNRGELFDSFVETLLMRERLFGFNRDSETVIRTPAGVALLGSLTDLAYEMQRQRVKDGRDGSALTALPLESAARFLNEKQRKQAASASLITLGDDVRFAHQLLQEYFAARAMRERIFVEAGAQAVLKAADIWKPERWWEPTNWEEATILLAGLYSDNCSEVIRWVAAANPEVAARCIVESGAYTPDETRVELRALWLPRLTDLKRDPDARARAAVGRALGLVTLEDGTLLDGRPGVGYFVRDGLRIPQIAWGGIVPAGQYTIGDDQKAYEPNEREIEIGFAYQLSRYPITYAQFDCFVQAPDFADARWWEDMPPEEEAYGTRYRLRELSEQAFKFWNHPREMVSWYQATAFCRWLRDKLGYEVLLPHEHEWEVAARYPDGRSYPWAGDFDATRANTTEGDGVGQTSPVGIYPHGAHAKLGLYDLSGNVMEWCRNKYDDPDDESVDDSGAWRVVRGGSWGDDRSYARAAYRDRSHPSYRDDSGGFRVVVRRPPSDDH